MKNRNEIAAVEFPVNPIRIRECKCGCGYEFQPNRKDQLYIDKRHYDFDYNQNKRKVKNKHIIETDCLQSHHRLQKSFTSSRVSP